VPGKGIALPAFGLLVQIAATLPARLSGARQVAV